MSSSAKIRCSHCGALTAFDAKPTCAFCGALLTLPKFGPPVSPVDAAPVPERRGPDRKEPDQPEPQARAAESGPAQELLQLRQDPRWSAWQAHEPQWNRAKASAGARLAVSLLALLVLLLVASGFGAFAQLISFSVLGGSPWPSLLVLAFFGLFIAVAARNVLRSSRKANQLISNRTAKRPARIVQRRVEVSGTSADSSSSFEQALATLEFEDGSREEFVLHGKLLGEAVVGDVGIAYSRGTHLLEFLRATAAMKGARPARRLGREG